MRRSLRGRLLVLTLAAAWTVLGVGAVSVYRLTRRDRLAVFDAGLADKARALSEALNEDGFRLGAGRVDLSEFTRGEDPSFFSIRDEHGRALAGAATLAATLARPDGPAVPVRMPNGNTGRALVRRALGPYLDELHQARQAVTVTVARDTDDIEDGLARLATLLVALAVSAGLALAAALRGAIRRGLRPVDELAIAIAALGDQPAGAEVRLPDAPVELEPVVARLNELLGRLAWAFERERAFAADVAHELRTPLAGLRTTLEVTLARERSGAEYVVALSTCEHAVTAMGELVEQLLLLARLDAGRQTLRLVECRPAEVVRAAWAARAAAQPLQLTGDLDLAVTTDGTLLARIVTNLLDNAVSHGPPEPVRVALTRGQAEWSLRVANDGSLLDQAQAEQAFGRCWRGDDARADVGSHSGLGLTLVRGAAAALGGTATATAARGGEFAVTVTLPS